MEIIFTEREEEDIMISSISDSGNFLLDENGFPSLSPHLPSEQVPEEEEEEEEEEEDESDDDDAERNVEEEEEEESIPASDHESFASDFYRSGTDWSCLLEEKKASTSTSKKDICLGRKLKQTDLLQLWGLKKKQPDETISKYRVSSSLPFKDSGKARSSSDVVSFNEPMDRKVSNSVKKKMSFGTGYSARRRTCPFYKKIPGTPFTVDAFRYGLIEGCSAYFLSHFHYDHYGGLSKGWSHGPIYCTPLTARLVRLCLSVNPSFICPLELDTEYVIKGIKVTMLEANHCPGAALIFFRLADGRCLLHTGDFRACKLMQSHPLLVDQRIHLLYLDTTYCNPKYTFPPVENVLGFVVKVTRDCLKKQPKTLVVVGAYSIGKERVYLAISEALGVKIYTNASRRRILQSFGWPEFPGRLCSHAQDTPLHVLPISSLRHETLKQYLATNMQHYQSVLAFRPTGWTYSGTSGSQLDLIKPSSRDNITIYGVPYSEHSSFLELREFVQFLKPEKIIPTVNIGNAAQRDKMQSYFREWLKA